jgi:YidC/Oxa1 family membrane protein insertase
LVPPAASAAAAEKVVIETDVLKMTLSTEGGSVVRSEFLKHRDMIDRVEKFCAAGFESPEVGGVKLVKTYTFKRGSYAVAVKHEVVNTGAAPSRPQLYLQLVRDGNKPPGESSFYFTFTGPAVYTDAKKYQKVEFKRHRERQRRQVDKASPTTATWPWCSTTLPAPGCWPDGVKRELFMRKVDNNLYSPWA